MARAKRTIRAEARRRYRAEHGLPDESIVDDETPQDDAAPSRRMRPDPAQPARMGIGSAFRLAFRPLDLRGDLQVLPRLLRNKAFLVPVVLTVAATALALIVGPAASPTDPPTAPSGDVLTLVAAFAFTYFIQPPAFGGVLIAGFFAPRASWLVGALVGLVSAVCYAVLVLNTPVSPTATVSPNDVILSGFLFSSISGAFFASGAAWYRRFLQLSSPNRGRARPTEKRGNDGRSRTANQKAGARR